MQEQEISMEMQRLARLWLNCTGKAENIEQIQTALLAIPHGNSCRS